MKNQMKQQLQEWIENIRLLSNGKAAGPFQISIKRDKEYAEELYYQTKTSLNSYGITLNEEERCNRDNLF
ncbi:unnamed protein product [Rhizophagus irregularis]|nr:unnamed protein product [Rhizophagus irregularis]